MRKTTLPNVPLPIKHKLVRRKTGLPFIGMVVREDKNLAGEELWVVYQYGYSNREIGWLKSDCETLDSVPDSVDIQGWLYLMSKNSYV